MDSILVSNPTPGVWLVELNRPDRLNALDRAMVSGGLKAAFESIGRFADARVMILTGVGRAFCAGGDLDSESFSLRPEEAETYIRAAQQTVLALSDVPLPTIAAINGPVAGGGVGLALACDFRLAAPAATFSVPFARMGLVPDLGVSYLLPQVIGPGHAVDLALSGRKVEADEAMRLGLVDLVSTDLMSEALDKAKSWLGAAPGAGAATKRLIHAAREHSIERHLLEFETGAQVSAMQSSEFADRFAAYRTKLGR